MKSKLTNKLFFIGVTAVIPYLAACADSSGDTPPPGPGDPVRDALVIESFADITVDEGDGGGTTEFTFTLKLNRDVAANEIVSFKYATQSTTGGNDADESDYTDRPVTEMTIEPGEGSATVPITVTVNADDIAEQDETFEVVLTSLTGFSAGTTGDTDDLTATATIRNDDTLEQLSIESFADIAVDEGDGGGTTEFTFTLILNRDVAENETVSFDYGTQATMGAGSHADDASDYNLISPPIPSNPVVRILKTIATGAKSATVTVEVNADDDSEQDETFQLVLSDLRGFSAGTTGDTDDITAVATIRDDDLSIVSFADIAVNEGDVGSPGSFVFTLTLSRPVRSGEIVSFNYATQVTGVTDSDAVAGDDYTAVATPMNVTVNTAGAGSAAMPITIPITVVADTVSEQDETFEVVLSDLTGFSAGVAGDNDDTARAVIQDDDLSITSFADIAVNEGDSGSSGSFVFTLTLSRPLRSNETVSFNYATQVTGVTDSDAVAGDDYTAVATPMNVTVNTAGAGSAAMPITIPITVVADAVSEQDETFEVVLSSLTGFSVGVAGDTNDTARATIQDDDLSITSFPDIALLEGDPDGFVFTLTLSRPVRSGEIVSFEHATQATAGGNDTDADANDYTTDTTTPTEVIVAATNSSATITVPVKADDDSEQDETFEVVLSSLIGFSAGVPGDKDATARAVIQDDDLSIASFADIAVLEGNGGGDPTPFTFTLTLSRLVRAGEAVSFKYATRETGTGSSHADASDYTAVAVAADATIIAVGMKSATMEVPVVADDVVEQNETFELVLSALTGFSAETTTGDSDVTAVATIRDDEVLKIGSFSDISQGEGNLGSTSNFVFTLTLNRAVRAEDGTVSFKYVTQLTSGGNDANADDFTTVTTPIEMTVVAPNSSATIEVSVTADDVMEQDETFEVLLFDFSGFSAGTTGDSNDTAEATISNDDLDTDGDDIVDQLDACPNGVTGWKSSDFNDVDGDGCRTYNEDVDLDGDGLIEIRTPGELNSIRYNLAGTSYISGTCSVNTIITEETCVANGIWTLASCSDDSFDNQADCEVNYEVWTPGSCTDGTSADRVTCENAVRTPETWTPGSSDHCSNGGNDDQEDCEDSGSTWIQGSPDSCSDGSIDNQADCVKTTETWISGTCSDGTSADQSTCQSTVQVPTTWTAGSPGSCDNGSGDDQEDCEDSGSTWIQGSPGSCSDSQFATREACEAGNSNDNVWSPDSCNPPGRGTREACEMPRGTWTLDTTGDARGCGGSMDSDGNPITACSGYEIKGDIILNENWTPVDGTFTGTFDGNGDSIRSMTINDGSTRVGFFSILSGTVRNLRFRGPNASVTSTNARGDSNNVTQVGTVAGQVASNGMLDKVSSEDVSVTAGDGTDYAGGLVGANNGTIQSSYATGRVDGGAGDRDSVGGLVGSNGGTIQNGYAAGNTTGSAGLYDLVGGLAGYNDGTIRNTYAKGDVNGGDGNGDSVGGLVGSDEGVAIQNSYATGNVDGGAGDNDSVGGLVGYDDGTYEGLYYNSEAQINGDESIVVVVGTTGKTLAELNALTMAQTETDFGSGNGWSDNDWDFSDTSKPPVVRSYKEENGAQVQGGILDGQ